tara:strand:- start:184 stop:624 length:441 start_codon:yes stop_codon:yes gene_type:complete
MKTYIIEYYNKDNEFFFDVFKNKALALRHSNVLRRCGYDVQPFINCRILDAASFEAIYYKAIENNNNQVKFIDQVFSVNKCTVYKNKIIAWNGSDYAVYTIDYYYKNGYGRLIRAAGLDSAQHSFNHAEIVQGLKNWIDNNILIEA